MFPRIDEVEPKHLLAAANGVVEKAQRNARINSELPRNGFNSFIENIHIVLMIVIMALLISMAQALLFPRLKLIGKSKKAPLPLDKLRQRPSSVEEGYSADKRKKSASIKIKSNPEQHHVYEDHDSLYDYSENTSATTAEITDLSAKTTADHKFSLRKSFNRFAKVDSGKPTDARIAKPTTSVSTSIIWRSDLPTYNELHVSLTFNPDIAYKLDRKVALGESGYVYIAPELHTFLTENTNQKDSLKKLERSTRDGKMKKSEGDHGFIVSQDEKNPELLRVKVTLPGSQVRFFGSSVARKVVGKESHVLMVVDQIREKHDTEKNAGRVRRF